MHTWPSLLLPLLSLTLTLWTRPMGVQSRGLQCRPGGTDVASRPAHSYVQQFDGSSSDRSDFPRANVPVSGQAASETCSPCRCCPDENGLVADCSGQNLTDIPPSIPNNITALNLTRNRLSMENLIFSRFPQLRVLDISDNGIQNISNCTFNGLNRLEVLLLDRNRLRYTSEIFTEDIFKPLQSLRHLTLHGNTEEMRKDLGYPDLALSHTPLLENLTLDGLTNTSFGPGFRELRNLTCLSLSGFNSEAFCELDFVFNDTFVNLQTLQQIDLSKCFLTHVESGSLLPLEHIHTIDVSMNRFLGFENLERASYGFQDRTIRRLIASYLYEPFHFFCVFAKRDYFQYLKHVEEIDLSYNMIVTFEQGALLPLAENLKVFYAKGNLIFPPELIFELQSLKNLHTVDLSFEWYASDNEVRNAEYEERYSTVFMGKPSEAACHTQPYNTTRLAFQKYLQTSALRGVSFKLHVPPKLRVIRVTGRLINEFGWEFEVTNNSIEMVDFSWNLMRRWEFPVHGLNRLSFLNLSRNYADHLKPAFFASLTTIETLDISFNLLGDEIVLEDNVLAIANMTSLRILNISHNRMYTFPDGLTQGLPALEHLNLKHNMLEVEGFQVNLRQWKNLSFLNLRNNYLAGISQETRAAMDELAAARNFSVDLRDNPFRCECSYLDFLQWLNSTRVALVSREKLTCRTSNESKAVVGEVLEALQAQCTERVGVFLGAVLGSMAILAVLVGLVLYHCRWKVRYFYYAARDRYRRVEGAQTQYRYDAFISYASEDYEWVRGELQRCLERDHGLRLCIHQRDFLPGTPIAANIVDAVQTSRRTVCVLSENFLDSHWCTYEMQMAKMEGLHTGRDVVLLLLYDHTIKRALPREIVYYILSESYLEYPGEQGSIETFWSNLVLALKRS